MSDLHWIPHQTEVWAVARSRGGSNYALEDPVDFSTTESQGSIIDLSPNNMRAIVTQLTNVSGML